MEMSISDKQQCVIDALLYKEKLSTFQRTLDEITKACNFMSSTQAASVLGTLKRQGITVKSGNKWRLTGQYLEALAKKNHDQEKCAPQKASDDLVIDLPLKIEVLQKLSEITAEGISVVLDHIIEHDLKGAA